jgi:hypothetical protein
MLIHPTFLIRQSRVRHLAIGAEEGRKNRGRQHAPEKVKAVFGTRTISLKQRDEYEQHEERTIGRGRRFWSLFPPWVIQEGHRAVLHLDENLLMAGF